MQNICSGNTFARLRVNDSYPALKTGPFELPRTQSDPSGRTHLRGNHDANHTRRSSCFDRRPTRLRTNHVRRAGGGARPGPGAKTDARELREFGRTRLANFKVPSVLQILPEIPKEAGGKINRSGLADKLGLAQRKTAGKAGNEVSGFSSDLERELIQLW